MVNLLPFGRTGRLINEIDQFIDKVSEAVMVLEQSFMHYLEHGADGLDERVVQIRNLEKQGDELRRSIADVMYSEMLMPDSRGDLLRLTDDVDEILDKCTHLLVHLDMERPEIPREFVGDFKASLDAATTATDCVMQGVRAYLKEPHGVRNHVNKVGFHEEEATSAALRLGRAIFDSDLPLERKRQLRDWAVDVRVLASVAEDIGDKLRIYAIKRSI